MSIFQKLNKVTLNKTLFIPRELKVSTPLNSFNFYSIEVNWFSRKTKDNSNIIKNPENYINSIDVLKDFEFSWIVKYKSKNQITKS